MDLISFADETKTILLNENIEVFGFSRIFNNISIPESYKEMLPSSLEYLKKEVWSNLKLYIPWAKSVILVAIPYNTIREKSSIFIGKERVWVSRYAFGEDYHKVLRNKLKPLKNFLINKNFKAKICVDSFPILERSHALKAGLGFIGKNGLLINPHFGSYIFLGEIITNIEMAELNGEQKILENYCKDCFKCVKACPTKAIIGDGSINPSKCISSYNVEWKGELPNFAPNFFSNLFGCDICQEVCPFNNKAPLTKEKCFYPKEELFAPKLSDLIKKDEKAIAEIIKKTPLERRGALQIMENLKKIFIENQTNRDETEVSL